MQQLQKINKKELATLTENKFLETYNPKQLSIAFRKVQTPLQAIDQGGASLFALKNTVGEKKVSALIKLYLIEMNDLFNLKRPLTEQMIEAITDEVIAQYGYLNMADIHLIFRRAKNGDYGDMFETLNMPKVMTWFKNYFEERLQASANRSQERAAAYKNDFNGRTSTKEAKKEAKATIMRLRRDAQQNEQ